MLTQTRSPRIWEADYRVTAAVMSHLDQKQVGVERFCLAYTSTLQSIEGNQGRTLEAGVVAEALDGYSLLACSPWHALPAFLENLGPLAQG